MSVHEFSSGNLKFTLWKSDTGIQHWGSHSEIRNVYRDTMGNPDFQIEITIIGRGATIEDAHKDLENKVKAMGGAPPKKKGK